ncbi:MAG: diaminopimelate epimerase [Sedimentisphaerales bacterium]|nr:diaminopimelate epimerase [Sedimentisphaerales bacterium]
MRFTKMHGLGNDYVFVDCFSEKVANPVKIAIEISDRHFGVGADGLILICPSRKADAKMRIFNADGSEAEMCGNGIRCLAKYVYEHKLAKPGGPVSMGDKAEYPASLKIETKAGVLTLGLDIQGSTVANVCVNMGEPRFRPKDIPVKLPGKRIIEHPIDVLKQRLPVTCVSMGNPHAVFFCDEVEWVELDLFGPAIENSRIFPRRTNVHFVEVESKTRFRMRTWERGSGITLACGTGACACCVAAAITGRCGRRITAKLPGGHLLLNWSTDDNCVYMAGPAIKVFEGNWP